MKNREWWSPGAAGGTLLSSRWVQPFVLELPALRQAELEAVFRFKLQALLPVATDDFAFHTRFFKRGGRTYGAAFLVSDDAEDSLPAGRSKMLVGAPIALPRRAGSKVLLFVCAPEGLWANYYENAVLKITFAPIEYDNHDLRSRIVAECPGSSVLCLAPDPEFPVPGELRESEVAGRLRDALLGALPSLREPPPRRWLSALSIVLCVLGLTLCAVYLDRGLRERESRNAAWKAWATKSEASVAARSRNQDAKYIKAIGAPVPELFGHLARDWGDEVKIIDFEWADGQLTLIAASPSALDSLKKLTADPWFRALRILDIQTRKDGTEEFTVKGGLSSEP